MDMDSTINDHCLTQEEALIQFRKMLFDVLTPDVTDKVLLKWLRTKNFNLRKCEELYRGALKCRDTFRLEELDEIWTKPEVIRKYEFANHLGIAKDGTPIHYIAMGRGDLKGFLLSLDVYDVGKYCCSIIERDVKRCRELSRQLGKDINEITYITDMGGFNLKQIWFSGILELGMDLFRLLQDHYPEVWKNILIVNAPFYFQTLFNFFKPIFKIGLLEKIHVVSRDKTPNLLLKYVDADVLPEFLGGKRVDSTGDPMCSEFMKFGGIVPERYYLRNRPPLLPTDPGVEDVWLQPKSCLNVSVVVREANSILRVEIRTEGGSLPGCLLYRALGPDPENPDVPTDDEYLDPHDEKCNVELCGPCVHIHAHVAPVNNCCYAPWPGIYIFRFDNSYNWLSPRRCIYRIRAVPPSANVGNRNQQN